MSQQSGTKQKTQESKESKESKENKENNTTQDTERDTASTQCTQQHEETMEHEQQQQNTNNMKTININTQKEVAYFVDNLLRDVEMMKNAISRKSQLLFSEYPSDSLPIPPDLPTLIQQQQLPPPPPIPTSSTSSSTSTSTMPTPTTPHSMPTQSRIPFSLMSLSPFSVRVSAAADRFCAIRSVVCPYHKLPHFFPFKFIHLISFFSFFSLFLFTFFSSFGFQTSEQVAPVSCALIFVCSGVRFTSLTNNEKKENEIQLPAIMQRASVTYEKYSVIQSHQQHIITSITHFITQLSTTMFWVEACYHDTRTGRSIRKKTQRI